MTSLSQYHLTVEKFTNQDALGHYLLTHYNIRNARDLTSCETCHR